MTRKEKYKEYAIGIGIGAIVLTAIAFRSLFTGQPKQFFCNSAEIACNISNQGLSVYDPTPYSDCDSCCPGVTDTCSGKITPYVGTNDGTAATAYCAQFACSETGRTCGAEYISHIAMIGWQCTCETR